MDVISIFVLFLILILGVLSFFVQKEEQAERHEIEKRLQKKIEENKNEIDSKDLAHLVDDSNRRNLKGGD